MRRILQRLNKEVGVKGSMIVHEDGLVVMAEFPTDLDIELVAAIASTTISSTKKSLKLLGYEKFDRFILTATHGRMVFVDIEPAFLVVVTEKNIDIQLTILEITGAARRIKNLWQMKVD